MKGNKTVVLFLLKFFGTYLLLFLLYSLYLGKTQNEKEGEFTCAPVTKTVADQTKYLLTFFGYNAKVEQDTKTLSIKLFLNNKFTASIVEGCNSMSIIILFISFIVAFSGKFKTTVFYILFGSLLIYFTNIVRIAIITIALHKYPEYEKVLHEIIFPSIIYGITFLLWFIWVRKFSTLKK